MTRISDRCAVKVLAETRAFEQAVYEESCRQAWERVYGGSPWVYVDMDSGETGVVEIPKTEGGSDE